MKLKTLFVFIIILTCAICNIQSQTTAFTYQGRLNDNGAPANGNYDLQFSLRDAVANGNQIGNAITTAPVAVSNGLFTVALNFGANAFPGADRWLEIGVRTNGSASAYTTLTPRQALTPAPYSLFAANSGVAALANSVPNGAIGVNQLASNAVSEIILDTNLIAKVNSFYNWSNANRPVFTSPTTTNGYSGVPFYFDVTATNYVANFYSSQDFYTATGLPNGLSLGFYCDPVYGCLGTHFGISGTPTQLGGFPIILTVRNIAGVTTQILNLTLTAVAPTITNQPIDQVVFIGNGASFSVSAIGTTPFSYQWQKNGFPVAGATNATYDIASVLQSQSGNYSVTVSNYVGLVTSSNATLTVYNVLAWGDNGYGQTNVPAGLTNVVAVAGGQYHSLALQANGTVAAWGFNSYGQTNVPAGLSNVVAVAAGDQDSLALQANGTVAAWGFNGQGETTVPAGLSNVVTIAAGYYHSIALQANGTVAAWGYNVDGETTVPAGLSNVVALAAGANHSLALRSNGIVVAWGGNTYGQTTVPAGLSNVVALAAGIYHSLALQANGTVAAWGHNGYGQTTVPAGLSNVVAVAAGLYHSLALQANGTLVAWGYNANGQTIVPAGLTTNIIAIAGGYEYSVIAADDVGKPKLAGKVGVAFSYQIQPSGKPTYYAIGLPAGLTLNANTGLVTGIPSAAGTRSVLLGTRNAVINAGQVLSLTIAP